MKLFYTCLQYLSGNPRKHGYLCVYACLCGFYRLWIHANCHPYSSRVHTALTVPAIEFLEVARIACASVWCCTVAINAAILTHWHADLPMSCEASVAYTWIVYCERQLYIMGFFLCSFDRASRYIYVIKTNLLLHCLSSVYFVSQPLHVLGISVAHHQEVCCIYTIIGTCCAF